MHILNNLKNYLYDQNHIVNIYDNHLYLFNYAELLKITDNFVKVKFDEFELDVTGRNFFIYKMTVKEMLIKGEVDNVRFIR